LGSYGQGWMEIESDARKVERDMAERVFRGETNSRSNGFYAHNMRDDLLIAVREFFFDVESHRSEETAYDRFARHRVSPNDTLITFNYDVALDRALAGAGTWDIGWGYGFPIFTERPRSPLTLFKLHGSVNWFAAPMQSAPPPLMFPRDLELLGYKNLRDRRIGTGGSAAFNQGTVILPDSNKQFYWENLWQPLWGCAAERLRGVQEVFIHGYSMPSADARACGLLFDNVSHSAPIHVLCRCDFERVADDFRRVGFSDVRPDPRARFEEWAS